MTQHRSFFHAVKHASLSPPVSREHMKVSSNPDVFREAEAKHGTAELHDGGHVQTKRAKRARGGKVVGAVTGKEVRQRLDRAPRRKRRDEGGAVPEERPALSRIADAIRRVPEYADYIGRQIAPGVVPAGEPHVPDSAVVEYYARQPRQGQRARGGGTSDLKIGCAGKLKHQAETAEFAHAGSGGVRRGGRVSGRR